MLNWPALQLDRELPAQVVFEQGVWGKVHGAPTDYRWIATTPSFTGVQNHLDRELLLGTEDSAGSSSGTFWRSIGDSCYAGGFYLSRSSDATNRSGFLEKQILEWKRPAGVPAAFGAFLLLDAAARLDDSNWWGKRAGTRWSEDVVGDLPTAPPLQMSITSIEHAVGEGLRVLAELVTEESLSELYAEILANGRAVSLKELTAPLPAAAVAALLLPLPRTIADRISIASWLPSTWLSESDVENIHRCWDVVLAGATPPPTLVPVSPTADQRSEARNMAKAILTGSAEGLTAAPDQASVKPVEIALWGPTAAGKTALVAKLFLDAEDDENWEVYPTPKSRDFIKKMRERMRTGNQFPVATAAGHVEGIEYIFTHKKTKRRSSLQLEDRAGLDSEKLEEETGKVSLRKRLTTAEGLVLVFDPLADELILEERVSDTLELLNIASGRIGRKEERPIAVCVSKADVLIETPKDFDDAVRDPHKFVREHVPRALVRPLDRYCTNFRLFPVSAVGVRLRRGVIEPAVFVDEHLESRICPGSRPFNLMKPFCWLLDQLMGQHA